MLKLIWAQFKREYWEHKGVLLWVPLGFSAIILSVVLAGILFVESSDSIAGSVNLINIDGGTRITISKNNQPTENLNNTQQLSDEGLSKEDEPLIKSSQNSPELDKVKSDIKKLSSNPLLIFSGWALSVFIVAFLSSSLSADRKDNSILLWRSMPVSEEINVLVKCATAYIVLPLIYAAITLITLAMIVVMVAMAKLTLSTPDVGIQLTDAFAKMFSDIIPFILLLLFLVIWLIPLYGWLGLVASYPGRLVAISAALPIVGITLIEWLIFGTDHFSRLIIDYVQQGLQSALMLGSGQWAQVDYQQFLVGLMVSAVFIYTTIQIRKWRID